MAEQIGNPKPKTLRDVEEQPKARKEPPAEQGGGNLANFRGLCVLA